MVCCPCFVIPLLLWVFHKFISPWLTKLWGKPAEMVKDAEDKLVCPVQNKENGDSKTNCEAAKTDSCCNGSTTVVNGHTTQQERLKAE